MTNVCKTDHNSYPSLSFPYALYVQKKRAFSFTWKFLGSFASIEEAKAIYDKLANLPILLGEK